MCGSKNEETFVFRVLGNPRQWRFMVHMKGSSNGRLAYLTIRGPRVHANIWTGPAQGFPTPMATGAGLKWIIAIPFARSSSVVLDMRDVVFMRPCWIVLVATLIGATVGAKIIFVRGGVVASLDPQFLSVPSAVVFLLLDMPSRLLWRSKVGSLGRSVPLSAYFVPVIFVVLPCPLPIPGLLFGRSFIAGHTLVRQVLSSWPTSY